MEKLSLNIHVPAVGMKLDFLVPQTMKINKVIELIVKILQEEYQGITCNYDGLVLVDLSTNQALNPQFSCDQLGIENGNKFLLI